MVDNVQISTMLPDAKNSGINLLIERLGNDHIASIKTNKQSIDKIKGQTFKLFIHNGSELKKLEFKFEEDELKKIIPLNNELLFSVINVLTVFDEDFNPLVERMIYKDIESRRIPVSAKFMKKENDSLVLNITTAMDSISPNSLSISVLPSENKSYNPRHNINSSFELKPYLKGNIEHPQYYFSKRYQLKAQAI